MKFVIQRVNRASVTINNEIYSKINKGLLILAGFSDDDTEEDIINIVNKIIKLRIFEDNNGKTNLSLNDVNGEVLIVSQFTLYANCKKGNRPSFENAGKPRHAEEIYDYMINCFERNNIITKHGSFGEDMKINLENDGPFTIIL